jgi:hypothetical protein
MSSGEVERNDGQTRITSHEAKKRWRRAERKRKEDRGRPRESPRSIENGEWEINGSRKSEKEGGRTG